MSLGILAARNTRSKPREGSVGYSHPDETIGVTMFNVYAIRNLEDDAVLFGRRLVLAAAEAIVNELIAQGVYAWAERV